MRLHRAEDQGAQDPGTEAGARRRGTARRLVRASSGGASAEPENRELIAERDRLLEKFTVMQADLGGAFYEMAIRDHVKMDVLTRKAAELQRLDIELGEVEEALAQLERSASDERLRQLRRAVRAGREVLLASAARSSEAEMSRAVRWVIDTAGSVTGTRFRLVMASSATATALIIGSTLASGGDSGLASQLRAGPRGAGRLVAEHAGGRHAGARRPSTPTASKGGRVPAAGLLRFR